MTWMKSDKVFAFEKFDAQIKFFDFSDNFQLENVRDFVFFGHKYRLAWVDTLNYFIQDKNE